MNPIPRTPTSMLLARCGNALALAGLVLLFLGCDTARTRQPLGGSPPDLSRLQLEGTWQDAEGRIFYLRTVDPTNAALEVATVETNEAGFHLERTEAILRENNGTLLANLRATHPDPDPDYAFGRLTVAEGGLIFEPASSKRLRDLILGLKGAVGAEITRRSGSDPTEDWNVVVTNGFDHLTAPLTAPGGEVWFDRQHPVIWMRHRTGPN